MDEIGVGSAEAVVRVGIVIGVVPLFPNKIHDLVFSFAGAISVGEDYLDVLPSGIVVESVVNVVSEALGELMHEGCARSDAVRVEMLPLSFVLGQSSAAGEDFLLDTADIASSLFSLFSGTESTTALLVHLGTRSLELDGIGDKGGWR